MKDKTETNKNIISLKWIPIALSIFPDCWIKQEIIDTHIDDSILIPLDISYITGDDDFLESVSGIQ